jgi:16S rRNA (guanine527-N7)-methyltransferase
MYCEKIKAALSLNGINANRPQTELLSAYLSELLSVNQITNLTAIKDPDEAIIKHIADCAICIGAIPERADLLDVGSGAGLPAFPFAILRPDISVTALDSTGKKVDFINNTAKKLGLKNLKAICHRAEELGKNRSYRERYTVVSARAVARLNQLSELCLPFVKVGGIFISMKSRLADMEKRKRESALASERRSQVGTGDRSERIRTYNFPQGRVTDHRIGLTLYSLENFMNGRIDEMIDALITADRAEKLKAEI